MKKLIMACCIATVLSGCSDSSGPGSSSTSPTKDITTTTITVIDGYLSNAVITLAVDGKCILEPEYIVGRTDDNAQITLTEGITGAQLCAHAVAGETIDSDRGIIQVDYSLSAPTGSKYITPYTDLAHKIMSNDGDSLESAKQKVMGEMNHITADQDLVFGDYIANSNDMQKTKLNAVAESIVDLKGNSDIQPGEELSVVQKVVEQINAINSEDSLENYKPIIKKDIGGVITVETNHRPAVIEPASISNSHQVMVGDSITIDFSDLFVDQDSDSLVYSVIETAGNELSDIGLTHDNGVIQGTLLNTPSVGLQLFATDEHGERSYPYFITITEVEDPAPILHNSELYELQKQINATNWIANNALEIYLDIENLFTDNDSSLNYAIQSDMENAGVAFNGRTIGLTSTGEDAGQYTLSIKAKDSANKVTQAVLTLTIAEEVQEVLRTITWMPEITSISAGQDQVVSIFGDYAVAGSLDITADATITSSNESILLVTEAGIRGVAEGTATLTATYGVFEIEQTVTVTEPRNVLTLDVSMIELPSGASITIPVLYIDGEGNRSNVLYNGTWSSTSPLVRFENGEIFALGEGQADITFTYNGQSITRTLQLAPPVPVSTIPEIYDNTLMLTVGDEMSEYVSVLYSDGSIEQTAIRLNPMYNENKDTIFREERDSAIGYTGNYVASWQADLLLDDEEFFAQEDSAYATYASGFDLITLVGIQNFELLASYTAGDKYAWKNLKVVVNKNPTVSQFKAAESPFGNIENITTENATLFDTIETSDGIIAIYNIALENRNYDVLIVNAQTNESQRISNQQITNLDVVAYHDAPYIFQTVNTTGYERGYTLNLNTLEPTLILEGDSYSLDGYVDKVYYSKSNQRIEKLDPYRNYVLYYLDSSTGDWIKFYDFEETINAQLSPDEDALDFTDYTIIDHNKGGVKFLVYATSQTLQNYQVFFIVDRNTMLIESMVNLAFPENVDPLCRHIPDFYIRNGLANGISDLSASCSTSDAALLWTDVSEVPIALKLSAADGEAWGSYSSTVFEHTNGDIVALWDDVRIFGDSHIRAIVVDQSGNTRNFTANSFDNGSAGIAFYGLEGNYYKKTFVNDVLNETYVITDNGIFSYDNDEFTSDGALSNEAQVGGTSPAYWVNDKLYVRGYDGWYVYDPRTELK